VYEYEYVYVGRRGASVRVTGGSLLNALVVVVLVFVIFACTARRAEAQAVQQCVASPNRKTERDPRERTAADTVFVVQIPGAVDDGLAGNDFFVKHDRLEFRGQFYFLGPSGMTGLQLPGTPGRSTPAQIVSVGEYAGVTLYAWEPVEPGIVRMLFVRREAHCGLQQYWHAAEVRHSRPS
jgi:hypothetical protein